MRCRLSTRSVIDFNKNLFKGHRVQKRKSYFLSKSKSSLSMLVADPLYQPIYRPFLRNRRYVRTRKVRFIRRYFIRSQNTVDYCFTENSPPESSSVVHCRLILVWISRGSMPICPPIAILFSTNVALFTGCYFFITTLQTTVDMMPLLGYYLVFIPIPQYFFN